MTAGSRGRRKCGPGWLHSTPLKGARALSMGCKNLQTDVLACGHQDVAVPALELVEGPDALGLAHLPVNGHGAKAQVAQLQGYPAPRPQGSAWAAPESWRGTALACPMRRHLQARPW